MNNPITINSPWDTLTVDAKSNGGYKILEILRGPNYERIFSVTANREKGLFVSTAEDQVKIALDKDHRGAANHFKGKYIFTVSTSLGEISLEWCKWWGNDPIPPGGVVGWINLHTKTGPFQFVTLLADETGSALQAVICANETLPTPTTTIKLCETARKGSGRTWTLSD